LPLAVLCNPFAFEDFRPSATFADLAKTLTQPQPTNSISFWEVMTSAMKSTFCENSGTSGGSLTLYPALWQVSCAEKRPEDEVLAAAPPPAVPEGE
jgi:hypothetical protein